MGYSEIYGNYLSLPDCAKELKLSPSTVWYFVKNGRLKAVDIGDGCYHKIWGVNPEDFNEFKKTYIKYHSDTRSESHKGIERKKKEKEINDLKVELKELSAKLLEISVRLEELSNNMEE